MSTRSLILISVSIALAVFIFFSASNSGNTGSNNAKIEQQQQHVPIATTSVAKLQAAAVQLRNHDDDAAAGGGGGALSLAECHSEFKLIPEGIQFHQVRLPRAEGGGTVPFVFLRTALYSIVDVIDTEAKDASEDGRKALAKLDKQYAMRADVATPKSRKGASSSSAFAAAVPLRVEDTKLKNHRVWIFAADGTLLNLLRWGSIVNDNDIDLSFLVLPHDLIRGETGEEDWKNETRRKQVADLIHEAIVNRTTLRRWYVTLLQALVRANIIEQPDARQLRGLRNQFKPVKPGRCLLRRGFMQCRHPASEVLMDFFGPENSFVGRPGFPSSLAVGDRVPAGGDASSSSAILAAAASTLLDFFPLRECKAWTRTLPCPANAVKVLKTFTLDHAMQQQHPQPVDKKRRKTASEWFEFGGCALFTLKKEEHDRVHVKSILETTKRLHDCGFPSLFEDRLVPECQAILRKA